MLKILVSALKPTARQLTGASIGEAHAAQIRALITAHGKGGIVLLDFSDIENASASYLKRIVAPFFAMAGSPEGFDFETAPILLNTDQSDLMEELKDYLAGKRQVLIVAKEKNDSIEFNGLIGELDGAANETFKELMALNETTAAQLYERHPSRTTNQTAWNNRLVQLVDLRLARRRREGRFWIYQSTVTN